MIPLVDLQRQYKTIEKNINDAVIRVFEKGDFILGGEVAKFENAFARYTGAKYCVGVGSGREAIYFALLSLGVGQGDEVITVANTFVSTIYPIIQLGAKPVIVDCDPNTYQIDIKKLTKAINRKTKAILPVHLYGYPSNMSEIMKIAKAKKLKIVEDACQAHGTHFNGKHVGTFGDVGTFSFYPGKNLGAAGDGGAVITNNKKIYDFITIARNNGQLKKYNHTQFGYNSRLDTIQAAVLNVKLKRIDAWNEKRRLLAKRYIEELSDLPVTLPPKVEGPLLPNYHLFVIRTKKRDALLNYLYKYGVNCGIHYPIPLHLQKSLKSLGYKKGDFPISERYAKEIISLPMFPELSGSEVSKISLLIRQFFQK